MASTVVVWFFAPSPSIADSDQETENTQIRNPSFKHKSNQEHKKEESPVEEICGFWCNQREIEREEGELGEVVE